MSLAGLENGSMSQMHLDIGKQSSPVRPGSHFPICHIELIIMVAAQHPGALEAAANLKTLQHQ